MNKFKKTMMSASLIAMVVVMGVMMTACGKGGGGSLGINITFPSPESLGVACDITEGNAFLSDKNLDQWSGFKGTADVLLLQGEDKLGEMRSEVKAFDNEMLMVVEGYGRDTVGDKFEKFTAGMYFDGTYTYTIENEPGSPTLKEKAFGNELADDEDMEDLLGILSSVEDIDLSPDDTYYLNSAGTVFTVVVDYEGFFSMTILHFESENLVKIENYFYMDMGFFAIKSYSVLENQTTPFSNNLPSMFNGKENWVDVTDLDDE